MPRMPGNRAGIDAARVAERARRRRYRTRDYHLTAAMKAYYVDRGEYDAIRHCRTYGANGTTVRVTLETGRVDVWRYGSAFMGGWRIFEGGA